MHDTLTLRRTVIAGDILENDYKVVFEGRPIGRIREATERIGFNPGWIWAINIPLPIPIWAHGQTGDFEQAKAAFRRAWERFYPTLTPECIARWHQMQDAAKRSPRL